MDGMIVTPTTIALAEAEEYRSVSNVATNKFLSYLKVRDGDPASFDTETNKRDVVDAMRRAQHAARRTYEKYQDSGDLETAQLFLVLSASHKSFADSLKAKDN